MKILVVDDSPASRELLQQGVAELGLEVFVASNGAEALSVLHREDIRLVVTDWMMPVMDGATLCRLVRTMELPGYVYLILLTARTNTEDIVAGMKAGADDYLTKPFEKDELVMRIRAGIRVLNLERTLLEKNTLIRRDLESAKKLQKSFLPRKTIALPGLEFVERLIPSAYVSGDIYSVFRLDERRIGFYHVDVMGHGVLAALFSVQIHQRLNHDLCPYGLLKTTVAAEPFYRINPPVDVARALNEENLLESLSSYFTMLYGVIDVTTGRLSYYRAGHNLPLLVRAAGGERYLEEGGAPIGLGIPVDEADAAEVDLAPGDCFVVFSDGVSECGRLGAEEEEYGFCRAKNILAAGPGLSLEGRVDRLIGDLTYFRGGSEFADDVSIIALRWLGPPVAGG